MKKIRYICSILTVMIFGYSLVCAQDNRQEITVKWRNSAGQVLKEQTVIAPRVIDSSIILHLNRTRYFVNGKQGLAALDGTVITEPIYDFIYTEHPDGTAGYQIGDKQGILNWYTGKQITPPIYDAVTAYSEGLAAVTLDGVRWGYIDTTGRMAIIPQWNFASAFQDGVAKIINGEDINRIGYLGPMDIYPTPGKAGYIDKDGISVIPMEYSYISTHTNSDNGYLRFTKGKYSCEEPNGMCENPYPSSKWGIIDIHGNIVLPDSVYDFIFPMNTEDKFLFGIEKNGKYGVLDPKTMQLIVPLYDSPNIEALTQKVKELRVIH